MPWFSSNLTVEYVDHMGSDERVIEAMLASTDKIAAADDLARTPGRINWLMRDKHGSPFEHTALTAYVEAPIKVFREWHRHRIGFSYNEMSGRYVILPDRFYVAPPERPLVQIGRPGHYTYIAGTTDQYAQYLTLTEGAHNRAYVTYEKLLELGIAKEAARDVLGTGIYSKMFVTLNLRSAFSFLALRTNDPRAHHPSKPMWEIEQCALALEVIVATHWPLAYEAFNMNGRVSP